MIDTIKIAQNVLNDEINEIKKLIPKIDHEFKNTVYEMAKSDGKVVIIGMGKSGHIGKKISATMASTGTESFFLHPAEAYHGDLGMIGKNDVVILISNSGETDEILRLLPFLRDNGNKTVSICGNKKSSLVKNTDYFIDISIEKEACPLALAPTTSTTATLIMGDALAISLMTLKDFTPEGFARFHPGGSLGRKLLTKVKDVMRSSNIPTNNLSDTVVNVIEVMTSGRIGMSVVIEEGAIKGVITDGDIRRVINKDLASIKNLKAADILTKNPHLIDYDEKIAKAEEIMTSNKITSLIVVKNETLCGILDIHSI